MSDDMPVFFRWRDPSWPPNQSLAVRFREQAVLNDEWTQINGYNTYDNLLLAFVAPVGQSKSEASVEIERRLPDGTMKVHKPNSLKYGDVIKAYKSAKDGDGGGGTPLKELGLEPGIIATMKARGIHSVEMLADITDSAGDNLMGFRGFREKALKFLELREKNAPTVRLEMELKQRDETIGSLQRQLDDLKAAVEREMPERRGPGRPRKVQPEEAEAA